MKIKEKPKLIVIVGQTSTGKSDFAVSLAQEIGGEIISADSRQVYKGLNLLSGKITAKEMKGVPHHLLDVVSPKKVFSVSDFKKKADAEIKKITARNKVPILVGGTGLYIDAVANGIILPEVPPNHKLRTELEKLSLQELVEKISILDPDRADTIDQKNKVRLVRAIEIATALGTVPKVTHASPYTVEKIGLVVPDEILKARIHARLEKRIKQGMIKEAKELHRNGLSWKRMSELGLECRYAALYLQGQITKKEMLEQLEGAIWQYAKRQKTWFKRDLTTLWIHQK